MGCQFNAGRYLDIVNNVSFSNHREHTDRLCCFFDPKGEEKHPLNKSGEIILVAGIIDAKDTNRPLQDIVLETRSFRHEHLYRPCPHLEFITTMEEKEAKKGLVLSASCTIYNINPNLLDDSWRWRLRKCKKYPGNELCHYDKFSCSPAEQIARAHAVHLYFFAMKKTGENDFLREFSAGIMRKYLTQWYIIPVPMKKVCKGAECPSK